ncbi:hypothetical protein P355_2133 [Burkholderia cenocepacia KC-01]|nr:hypothetical protein P355_2133 [Burkholderia cenocepacia KC-01]
MTRGARRIGPERTIAVQRGPARVRMSAAAGGRTRRLPCILLARVFCR